MKLLEKYESKKGNKLIFKQSSSDIPSLGSLVFLEKQNQKSTNQKYKEIGKIIDVFGPVKEPWVVVNLSRELEIPTENINFYWKKKEQFKKHFPKTEKRKGKKRIKN